MRHIGIDFGTKRIGIALSDPSGTMAFPHSVLEHSDDIAQRLCNLITELEADVVVIGYSVSNENQPNAVQTQINAIKQDISDTLAVPVFLESEQYTTQAALRLQGRNSMTDASAAALILDSFLQKKPTSAHTNMDTPTPDTSHTSPDTKETVSFDQFSALTIALGTIESVEVVPKADKLLRLMVNVGEEKPRQIISGIREYFPDEQVLVGVQCPFVLNLEPRTIRGYESQGMILAAHHDATFALLRPDVLLPPGTTIR